jgi:hypothetical protein
MNRLFHISPNIDNSLLIPIAAIIAIILQVMDKSFGNTFALSLEIIFPRADILVFGLMVLISIIIQAVLIRKARTLVKAERSKSRIGMTILVIATILQYFTVGILVVILFQTVFNSNYSVALLETIVGTNLITSSALLAILSSKFVRTFRHSQSKVVLVYTIAIAALSLSGITTFIYVDSFLQTKSDYITSDFNPWISYSPIVSPDLVLAYQIIGIVSFVTLWIATLFLTRHYASKSKIKYWIIVSIPLVYFASLYLITYLEHLDLLGQLGVEYDPIYSYTYNVFLNTVRTAGGIMFGIGFFVLSRTVIHSQLKNSLNMAGIGLILLFGANSSSLIIMTLYPPWGVISATFFIPGSYFLIVGLDSAAFYLATDSSLRRIVAKSPQKELDILKALAASETQEIVISKVAAISNEVYNEIRSERIFAIASEPIDVQEYINEVFREISNRGRASNI